MLKILVNVVYALPDRQYCCRIMLWKQSTIEQAIHASDILKLRQEINLQNIKVGIFGQLAKLQDKINYGDRIEIYRSLLIEPREWRRQRTAGVRIRK